ncbi:MAG: hypothetical protein E3J54_03175 [Actinobacteria bacterium]|nr:MAG: hypothetical protein E3J54_03175 [Actinomycetota bacterium]
MPEDENRFLSLEIISVALKVVAIVVAVVSVLLAIAGLFGGVSILGRIITFVFFLVAGAVQFFLIWATAEVILLLISIERNTFITKEEAKKGGMRPAA